MVLILENIIIVIIKFFDKSENIRNKKTNSFPIRADFVNFGHQLFLFNFFFRHLQFILFKSLVLLKWAQSPVIFKKTFSLEFFFKQTFIIFVIKMVFEMALFPFFFGIIMVKVVISFLTQFSYNFAWSSFFFENLLLEVNNCASSPSRDFIQINLSFDIEIKEDLFLLIVLI